MIKILHFPLVNLTTRVNPAFEAINKLTAPCEFLNVTKTYDLLIHKQVDIFEKIFEDYPIEKQPSTT
jgi:hypothetical protein